MVRPLIIIALAIACGALAAYGVNRSLQQQLVKPSAPVEEIVYETVLVANTQILRGERVTKSKVKEIKWPQNLIPGNVLRSISDVNGDYANSGFIVGEPIFKEKLTPDTGRGFIAMIIDEKMRAFTIQTRGPSASVAGFVRPGDYVDVLFNLRGSSNDQSGGGSSTTLLQNLKVLAVNQILDADVGTGMQILEGWTKGNELTSITLEVSLDQANRLFAAQSAGELSLTLRNIGDHEFVTTAPTSVKDIRFLELDKSQLEHAAVDVEQPEQVVAVATPQNVDAPVLEQTPETVDDPPPKPAPPSTLFRVFRGSQSSDVYILNH